MKILHLTGSKGEPKLLEGETQQPEPGNGELLIRVYAAGVTPTELVWYSTLHDRTAQPAEMRCRDTNSPEQLPLLATASPVLQSGRKCSA